MTKAQSQSSRYLTRRIAAAANVLVTPNATDVQRHGARCRLNRAIDALRRLEPIPAMSRKAQERLLGVRQEAAA